MTATLTEKHSVTKGFFPGAKAVRCQRIKEEHAGATQTERPDRVNCLKALRPGRMLLIFRMDRLGRNLADLVRIVGELETGQVGQESLSE